MCVAALVARGRVLAEVALATSVPPSTKMSPTSLEPAVGLMVRVPPPVLVNPLVPTSWDVMLMAPLTSSTIRSGLTPLVSVLPAMTSVSLADCTIMPLSMVVAPPSATTAAAFEVVTLRSALMVVPAGTVPERTPLAEFV